MVLMNISRRREKRKGFLLLFGSRAIGKGRKDSDYDFLHVYGGGDESLNVILLSKKYKGRISVDEIPLEKFTEGVRIGAPDILIISEQAVAISGEQNFKLLMYQNQGVTSLTITLCLEKADKLIKVAQEYLQEGFLREAAHRLAIAAFWIGAAYQFLSGKIPSCKHDTFLFLHRNFNVPVSLSNKFSSYEVADLEEPQKVDVQFYFKKINEVFRRFYVMAFEEYIRKAKKYLEKAKKHFASGDPDSSILMAHSAVELAIKGYLIKKTGKSPLYLLEALSNSLFLSKLKTLLGEDMLNKLVELNKMRNAVYHTTYMPSSNDAKFALSVSTKILEKISNKEAVK